MWICADCHDENDNRYRLCQHCASNERLSEGALGESGEGEKPLTEQHKIHFAEFNSPPPVARKIRAVANILIALSFASPFISIATWINGDITWQVMLVGAVSAAVSCAMLATVLHGIAEIVRNTNAVKLLAMRSARRDET